MIGHSLPNTNESATVARVEKICNLNKALHHLREVLSALRRGKLYAHAHLMKCEMLTTMNRLVSWYQQRSSTPNTEIMIVFIVINYIAN
jgi:predicted nucleic acid-binding protein